MSLDLQRHPDKDGWFLYRMMDASRVYNDPPEPPEIWWLSVSPKLRLFDYPGGPARGQLSKADFENELRILEQREQNTLKNAFFGRRYGRAKLRIKRIVVSP